jgi:hypothetical protein
MSERLRVVCFKPTLGQWCSCAFHFTKPIGVPEVLPGCKGTLVHLGKLEATVEWDGYPAPMILNKDCIREDKLAGHIVE